MTEQKISKKRANAVKSKGNQSNLKSSNTKNNPSTHNHKTVKKHSRKVTGLKEAKSQENIQNATVYRLMDSNGQALLPKPIKTISERPKRMILKSRRKNLNPEERYQRFLKASNRNDEKIIEQQLNSDNFKARQKAVVPETSNATGRKDTENSTILNKPGKLLNHKQELKMITKRQKGKENLITGNKPMKLFDKRLELKIEPRANEKLNIWNKPIKVVDNKPKSKIEQKVYKVNEKLNIWNKPIKPVVRSDIKSDPKALKAKEKLIIWNKPNKLVDPNGSKAKEKSNIWSNPNKFVDMKPDIKIEQKRPNKLVNNIKQELKIELKQEKSFHTPPQYIGVITKSRNKSEKISSGSQTKPTEKPKTLLRDFSGTLITKVNDLRRKTSNSLQTIVKAHKNPDNQSDTKITVKKIKSADKKNKNTSLETIYSGKSGVNKSKELNKNPNKKGYIRKIKEITSKENVQITKTQDPESKIQDSDLTLQSLESKIQAIESKVNVKKLKEKFSQAENAQIKKIPPKINEPIHHTFPFQRLKETFENQNKQTNDISTRKTERSTGGAQNKVDGNLPNNETINLTPRTDLLKMIHAMRENLELDPAHEPQNKAKDDIQSTLNAITATREKYKYTKMPKIVESNDSPEMKTEDEVKNDLSIEAQNLQRRAKTFECTKPLERAYLESNKLETKLLEKRKIQEKSEFSPLYSKLDIPRKSSSSLTPIEESNPTVSNAAESKIL